MYLSKEYTEGDSCNIRAYNWVIAHHIHLLYHPKTKKKLNVKKELFYILTYYN